MNFEKLLFGNREVPFIQRLMCALGNSTIILGFEAKAVIPMSAVGDEVDDYVPKEKTKFEIVPNRIFLWPVRTI